MKQKDKINKNVNYACIQEMNKYIKFFIQNSSVGKPWEFFFSFFFTSTANINSPRQHYFYH